MSMLTRGNGGHSKWQITQADGSSAQLKLMSLQTLKPAPELVFFRHM